MSRRDAFDRIVASLHDAMLDESHWPAAAARIEDACGIGTSGTVLVVGDGDGAHARIWFARAYARGRRRHDLERDYFENYYPHDERVPRIRELPEGRLVHVPNLYSEQELKTSLAYNEGLRRAGAQRGLTVRLAGPGGSRVVWGISDPVATAGWGSPQIGLIERLLPHVRQFVRVRQALADADALGASHAQLLGAARSGVIYLDPGGRIVEANDTARDLLRRGSGLSDRGGVLGAWLPADDARLRQLLADALRPFGGPAVGGSMAVTYNAHQPRLALHVIPLRDSRFDFGVPRLAALVLVADPAARQGIDPDLVAAMLGLTPAESEVAALLGEGHTVRGIAEATGRQYNAVRKHLKQAYRKLGIARQAELVRLVLSLPRDAGPRR